MVLLAETGSIWAKMGLFGQELLVFGRNGSLWAKVVLFWKRRLFMGKRDLFGKLVLFG